MIIALINVRPYYYSPFYQRLY